MPYSSSGKVCRVFGGALTWLLRWLLTVWIVSWVLNYLFVFLIISTCLHEKKVKKFFNMEHILHQLDDLTGVIWVIMSKKHNISHWLLLRICVIYIFTLFWSSPLTAHSCYYPILNFTSPNAIWLCHVIVMFTTSNVLLCNGVNRSRLIKKLKLIIKKKIIMYVYFNKHY